MQFKNLVVSGFAALTAAQSDQDSSTTDSVGAVAITSKTTATGVSTTLVPVVTPAVDTTTNVETKVSSIRQTTEVGTVPTNTVVQYATTSGVVLQSGYAFTTNAAGAVVATFTGTGTAASLTSTPSGVVVATETATESTTTTATTGTATGAAVAVVIGMPYYAAAALAGVVAFAA